MQVSLMHLGSTLTKREKSTKKTKLSTCYTRCKTTLNKGPPMKWKPLAGLHSGNVLLWASPLVHFEEEVIMNINICRSQGLGRVGFFHLLLKSGRDLARKYTCNS